MTSHHQDAFYGNTGTCMYHMVTIFILRGKKKLQATFSVFENLIDLTFYFTYCSVCGEGGGEGRGGPLIQELQLYNLGSVFWRTLHQELVSIA